MKDIHLHYGQNRRLEILIKSYCIFVDHNYVVRLEFKNSKVFRAQYFHVVYPIIFISEIFITKQKSIKLLSHFKSIVFGFKSQIC